MKKRLFALLLCMVMCCGLLSTTALASDELIENKDKSTSDSNLQNVTAADTEVRIDGVDDSPAESFSSKDGQNNNTVEVSNNRELQAVSEDNVEEDQPIEKQTMLTALSGAGEPDAYKVEFFSTPDLQYCTRTIEAGEVVGEDAPQPPTLEGKVFHCWTLNGTPFNLNSTPVNSDIRLIASWDNHTWDNGSITKEPTCVETGEKTFVCTVTGCGETIIEEIPPDPNAHDFSGDPAVTAATCTAPGSEVRTCQRDGCTETETHALDALGHDWGEWETTTAPTCTEKGSAVRNCSRCTAEETLELSAIGHNFVDGVCLNPGCSATQPVETVTQQEQTASAAGYTVTFAIYGPGTVYANGVQVADGQIVVYSPGTQITVEFRPDSGASLFDAAFNGESINVQNNSHQFTAMNSGSATVTGWFKVNAVQTKTIAQPRQEQITSGAAYTKAGNLAATIAAAYHLSDVSSIRYSVYNVTPIWSDGTEMSQDEIIANGGIAFEMAAPSGTTPTTHRYAVYHYDANGTYSHVTNSLSVTTKDFSPFAAFAIPLSASAGTVVVDPSSKITPGAPTVTPVNMERVDDNVTKTGGFSVLNAAYPIEYRQDGSSAGYISVSGNSVSGLTAGRYYVRYAATASTNPSGETLVPIVIDEYYTVTTKLKFGKGTVYSSDSAGYADNIYLVKKGNDITFRFEPESHYWLYEIDINGQYVGSSNVRTNYVLKNVQTKTTLEYAFSASSSSPKTGDESNVGLWVAVGAVSAIAIAGIAVYLLKKRK